MAVFDYGMDEKRRDNIDLAIEVYGIAVWLETRAAAISIGVSKNILAKSAEAM